MIINVKNPLGLSKEEAEHAAALSLGIVKLVCGVGNSAAHIVMLQALEQIQHHEGYKQAAKKAYKEAVKEMAAYRMRLLHPTGIRFFHLQDLPPDARKKFAKDATDRDYFDFWENSGVQAYIRTKPYITSLWNKYRLSLVNHNVPNPNPLAWAMTAEAALRLACTLHEYAIKECMRYGLSADLLRMLFKGFSLQPVAEKWEKALYLTEPATRLYDLDSVERHNIAIGLDQLCEEMVSPANLYGSTIESMEDYDEIFATKGYQKKAIRILAELRQETEEEMQKIKKLRHEKSKTIMQGA